MSTCKCGASVSFVQTREGERLPLESYGTTVGPRFVVSDYSTTPWTAEAIDPTSRAEGHSDHRESCPFRQ